MLDDREIIDLFYERSEQAVTGLDDRYGALCRQLARNILGSREDAEECVNDAYLAVWSRVPPERPQPLSAYLCRIVRNLALKRYHANTAKKRNSYYDAALEELSDCLAAPDSVDDLLSATELTGILNDFLGTLSAEERRLFLRRYWFSESVSGLAASFHVSENSVSVRLHRLRGRLKEHLRKEGYEI